MPVSGESGPNRSHALIRLVVPREQLWNFSANLWSLPLPRQRSHSLNSSESLRSQDTTLPTAVRFYPRGRKLGSSAASAITNADQHRLPQHHLQASATFNKDVLVKSPRRSCVFAILITTTLQERLSVWGVNGEELRLICGSALFARLHCPKSPNCGAF